MSLSIAFHWPKQVVLPCVSSGYQGNTNLLRKDSGNCYIIIICKTINGGAKHPSHKKIIIEQENAWHVFFEVIFFPSSIVFIEKFLLSLNDLWKNVTVAYTKNYYNLQHSILAGKRDRQREKKKEKDITEHHFIEEEITIKT